LQRAFLALGPVIAAFKQCRPVICIDGTFLTGKYKGTILTAVAADGNNQLLPLAIAFAEGENGDSWYWFLERLKKMVVGEYSDLCVINDRDKGILQVTNDIKEGSEECNRATQWPDVHSRWCMRHMGANFHSQFKNKELTQLFKRL
jgi:transposase-like protein